MSGGRLTKGKFLLRTLVGEKGLSLDSPITLIAAAVVCTLVGAAALGWWYRRRTLARESKLSQRDLLVHFILKYRAKDNQFCLDTKTCERVVEALSPLGMTEGHALAAAQLAFIASQENAIRQRRAMSYDDCLSDPKLKAETEDLLKRLWVAAFGSSRPYGGRSHDAWQELGFQGLDPTTDFRGGGMHALDQFVDFAETCNTEFKLMMNFNHLVLESKQDHWFLLAVVSIQVSAQILFGEFSFHEEHLKQLVYQHVAASESANAEASKQRSAAHEAARKDAKVTLEPVRVDLRKGLNALHHEAMRTFFDCWKRDKPMVMEFTNYTPGKVWKPLFSKEWKGPLKR